MKVNLKIPSSTAMAKRNLRTETGLKAPSQKVGLGDMENTTGKTVPFTKGNSSMACDMDKAIIKV